MRFQGVKLAFYYSYEIIHQLIFFTPVYFLIPGITALVFFYTCGEVFVQQLIWRFVIHSFNYQSEWNTNRKNNCRMLNKWLKKKHNLFVCGRQRACNSFIHRNYPSLISRHWFYSKVTKYEYHNFTELKNCNWSWKYQIAWSYFGF